MADARGSERDSAELPRLGPRGEGWIVAQVSIELAILALAPLFGGAWGGELGAVTSIAGFALIVAGVSLFGLGGSTLGESFSIWAAPRPGARLVVDGPYRFVRHPVCTSQVLLLVGWSMVSASPLGLALVVVLAFYLERLKLVAEEAALLRTYPAYAQYRQAVPHRMIPWRARADAGQRVAGSRPSA